MDATDAIIPLLPFPRNEREARKTASAILGFCNNKVDYALRILTDERYEKVLQSDGFIMSYSEVLERLTQLEKAKLRFGQQFDRDRALPNVGFDVLVQNTRSPYPLRYDSVVTKIYLSLLRRYDSAVRYEAPSAPTRPVSSPITGIQLSLYR